MAHLVTLRGVAVGLLALLGCLAGPGVARADAVSEAAVKAGFVFNFIKFTQWPNAKEGDRSPLQVCAVDANPLDGQLAALNGRPVGARAIEVQVQVPATDLKTCQVLVFSGADTNRIDTVIRGLGNAPVLTIADVPGFVQVNGMIGMRLEDNRVRFDVNLGAAQRAGLQLNSQMVQLAGRVLR
ncbi:YfiR family protein [Hydrogenophaga sp. PAMC20947]|uniref:YfiR family protein n=1 Tax=Hydrogenophaga sp. PAMC20947 TaxID=2565558 RepID=UPI00109DC593|nr:YfiR family protein [Hydrogenophaga sp. PAMC20947]QCB44681.1 YfiR family protein [Hydrogenophaga sp. PAMC20947]